jgi:hypothetical protein
MPKLLLVLLILAALLPASTAADFSASTVRVRPEAPMAGTVVSFDISLSNGGTAVPYAEVQLGTGEAALVDASGGCKADGPWIIRDWAPGVPATCRLELLTFRDAAGSNVVVHAEIRAGSDYWWVEGRAQLDTPPGEPSLFPPVLLAGVFLAR